MLGLQTDFRPPRASIQTPAAFLPERSPDEKRSEIYRACLPRSSVRLWAWLEPASYHGLVLYTLVRDGTESIIYLPPYLPHAVYCPIDFADRRTLYHRPARESSHLLLYMLLLTSGGRACGRESVRQVGKYWWPGWDTGDNRRRRDYTRATASSWKSLVRHEKWFSRILVYSDMEDPLKIAYSSVDWLRHSQIFRESFFIIWRTNIPITPPYFHGNSFEMTKHRK